MRLILLNNAIARKVVSRIMRVGNWFVHIGSASKSPLVAVPMIAVSVLMWGFPVWVGLLLIRPLLEVRFRPIPNRLGHLIIETDLYISNRAEKGRGNLTVWFFSGTPLNSFYSDKLPHHLTVWPALLAWGPFLLQDALSHRHDEHPPYNLTPLSISDSWINDGFGKDEVLGVLEKLGANPTLPYVCLWVRDSSYGERVLPSSDSWLQSHRDSRLSSYTLLTSRFEREGYSVIRMGMSEIAAGEEFGKSLVDYATSALRSDANDFLLAKFCSFAISGDSGSFSIPLLYRKPLALVNLGGPSGLQGGHLVRFVTMKTIVWEDSGEPLTLSQMLEHGVDQYTERSEFVELGVSHVDNTREELEGVADDILSSLRGRLRRCSAEYQIMEKDFLERVKNFAVFDPRFSPSQKWLVNNPHFAK